MKKKKISKHISKYANVFEGLEISLVVLSLYSGNVRVLSSVSLSSAPVQFTAAVITLSFITCNSLFKLLLNEFKNHLKVICIRMSAEQITDEQMFWKYIKHEKRNLSIRFWRKNPKKPRTETVTLENKRVRTKPRLNF